MSVDSVRQKPNDNWKAAGCLGTVSILVSAAWGSIELVKTLTLLKHGATTEAVITRLESSQDSNVASIPVFSFETDGDLAEVKAATAAPGYRVGETISVIYDPDNPQTARIRNFTDMWFRSVLPFAVAAVFAVVLAVIRWTSQGGKSRSRIGGEV